ncbi:hypothetical protein T265_09696 [Opisthorchis viverrini]|uniref:Uncharacterized protein n=1 Tax=Opisthorchis viverrini TaxID=6198 RepID=A0A074Z975_OPIVI|nr:hypothetical protein T265_09696 [Opisthorchis viverrini]KER22127.1 hypothetical protein T265_09696 [Opisthorchis viverrini]
MERDYTRIHGNAGQIGPGFQKASDQLKKIKSSSCSTLSVPSCHAIQRKHEGWDTARLPKPRQGPVKPTKMHFDVSSQRKLVQSSSGKDIIINGVFGPWRDYSTIDYDSRWGAVLKVPRKFSLKRSHFKSRSLRKMPRREVAPLGSRKQQEGSTRAGILPGCPSLDRGSPEAEVGFEPRTFRPLETAQWLRRQLTDRKVRGSNQTSASRLLLCGLGISALTIPLSGIADRLRMGGTVGPPSRQRSSAVIFSHRTSRVKSAH